MLGDGDWQVFVIVLELFFVVAAVNTCAGVTGKGRVTHYCSCCVVKERRSFDAANKFEAFLSLDMLQRLTDVLQRSAYSGGLQV